MQAPYSHIMESNISRELLLRVVSTDGRLVGVFADDDGSLEAVSVDAYGVFAIEYEDGTKMRHSVAMFVDAEGGLVRFDDADNFLGIVAKDDIHPKLGFPEWVLEAADEYYADADEDVVYAQAELH